MSNLQQLADQIEEEIKPPVHLWKPDFSGEIDIHIDSNGAWYHEGDPIRRYNLVKLFSNILWFEDSHYYLVTPVEKLQIRVDDVPFLIVEVNYIDEHWVATTNLSDQLIIGEDHKVDLRSYKGQWVPYVQVRYDLWARLSRNVYNEWVEEVLKTNENGDDLVLNSGDYHFAIAHAE